MQHDVVNNHINGNPRDDHLRKLKRHRREFYEEKMERELCERRDIERKIYCESKRKFQNFHKQIST